MALALSIIVFLSAGIRFTIGPFLKPISADLGLDRGSFSLVIALSLLLYGAFMPLVGRLVDRMGSRVVCSAGAVVMAASLVLTGRMTTLWEFYLYYAVIGSLGLAATGHVMGSVTLANWFVKRRGVAMSFLGSASMAGSSLGTWLGGFLFDVTGSYGAAFGVAGALLLIAAILSLSIDEKARPACRAVPIPSRPLPVAGGS
ncbi:MAG TPA: MFS transporter [Candidatus Acidoferrum sp.]|nr:MFS transporter [Candidatus Acidoferrum sp.]